MFFGTTPSIVSQYMLERIKEHKPKRVFVLFAGNFVIEQLAASVSKDIEIFSTDVSLYSRAIGFGATGQEFDAKLKQPFEPGFEYVEKLNTPIEKAAQVIFLGDVAKNLKKDIPYYKSLANDARYNQEEYIEKIKLKIEKFSQSVGHMKFYGVDACELVPMVKKGDLVFYDPPVLLGDYEKAFEALDACYEYAPVPYTEMTDDVKRQHLDHFTEIGATVYYRRNDVLTDEEKRKIIPESYKEKYRYQYKANGFYTLYSNHEYLTNTVTKSWVGRYEPLKEEVKNYPMIGKDDVITARSEVRLMKVKGTVSNHYRMMWVKKAEMSDGGTSYLVFVDGKLAGCLQLQSGMTYSSPFISIFSDPSCPFSRYERLSKLIMNICCTRETLEMFNEESMWLHEGFTTRVVTNAHSSMKYRGLFKKTDTKPMDSGNYKNSIIYQNKDKIFKTYKDALIHWLNKDGKFLQ